MIQKITEVRQFSDGHSWVVDILAIDTPTNGYVRPGGSAGECYVYKNRKLAEAAETLYLLTGEPSAGETKETNPKDIRTFDTGATRDTVTGKLSYVKALSPIVLQRYVQYLDAHRKQPDGSMREFDNWKKGIPEEAYLDGLGRHHIAAWLLAQGYSAEDNHGPVNLEDTLCAIIFGASGWLHELLEKKLRAEIIKGE